MIHAFCGERDCGGGNNPIGIVSDPTGDVFGVTYFGGAQADGTVFEISSDGGSRKYRILHDFCTPPKCKDSIFPSAAPIIDTKGNLYGTTLGSGFDDFGAIYQVSPNADRTQWTFRVLYRFAGLFDGYLPYGGLSYAGQASGLPYDGVSPLYGTTMQGGGAYRGTVYRLVPKAGTNKWRYDVLHQFCLTDCRDGASPFAGVTVAANGLLYGTTQGGGAQGGGTVFALARGKRETDWSLSTLYSFCSIENCPDGAGPYTPVTLDSAGRLYGTTQAGAPCSAPNGCGVIFRLSEHGGTWRETILHTFCGEENCADGASPSGPLVMDDGYLFGATSAGGAGDGVLFRLGRTYRVVHTFCAACTDGARPGGMLMQSPSGILLGITAGGGGNGGGTVFQFTPKL
ncbi:MAG TPA: choice-of-anchor tandem repeat GloVer-containing protein [Rhizomicrobium sp.]|nr:choice-of-anchor tandem repeat GloVer-containing protein [Rhizomicrobium sp.]